MADIFISFKTDDTGRVQPIHDGFRVSGLSIFWSNDIPKGASNYQAIIKEELLRAPIVVVVWTNASVHSGPVIQECSQAERGNKLFQILLDDIEPIDMPMEVRFKAQKTLLLGWTGDTGHPEWRKLNAAINARLGRSGGNRYDGRIKVDTKIVHGAPEGFFKPAAGRTEWFKDLDAGPEMVVVPAGSFTMGSSPSEIAALKKEYGSDWPDTEGPQRTVTIAAPLAVGRFALTFDEWEAAGLSHKPGDQGWGKGRRPAIDVSWEDAQAYVRWLSGRTGKTYRQLPESEWEYCCRAGTTTAFWWGDSISTEQANYNGEYVYRGGAKGDYRGRTVPVDSFEPNPWGLYQVHGNVGEWCQDNWHENYQGAPQDGSVRGGGDTSLCVVRGGSWNLDPWGCRSAFRVRYRPSGRGRFVGFRLARTL